MTLQFDPEAAESHIAKSDRRLRKVIRLAGPFTHRPEKIQSPFESLLRAIVYQQLSGKAAATIYGRLVATLPKRRAEWPTALLVVDSDSLRAVGMSWAKVAAVKDLAAKTLDGAVPTLARLKKMDDAEVVAHLTQVRGIGAWTVEMMLIFKLGRPDILPVSDLGVRSGFRLAYGNNVMPTPKELIAAAEPWRPFRSVASWYLWRAVDLHRAGKIAAPPLAKKSSKQ